MSETTTRKPVRAQEGEELFGKLAIAFSDHKIFSSKHPRFLESCQSFQDAVDCFFTAHPEQKNLLFVHRQGQIYFRKVPLTALTPPAVKLSRLFQSKEVEGIRFGSESNVTALWYTIEALSSFDPQGGETAWSVINRRLEQEGLKGRVGFFADKELSELDMQGEADPTTEAAPRTGSSLLCLPQLAVPLEIYKSTLAALHDLMCLVGAGANPQFDTLVDVTGQIAGGITNEEHSYLPMTTVQYSDQFTFNHSVNVCLFVITALKSLVKDPEELARVGQAALLHDLGKSLLPPELLYKAEIPSSDEKREMERHPALGAEILLDSGTTPLAAVVAFDHHRRPDGGGYPAVRRERPIDILTCVIAAADLFEALIAERPYKRSLSPAEAFQICLKLPEAKGLEGALRLLYDTISPFPAGTLVELESGEFAVVTKARPQSPTTPCVRLISWRGGELEIAAEESDLAVASSRGSCFPQVRRALPATWTPTAGEEQREEDERLFDARLADGTLLASEG